MADKKNTIGRFEIIEKIGEGPIGAVYKALDPVIRRTVAIKVIKLYALEETATFAEVFEKIYRVVRTSTSLNHPNICIIYDLSEEKKIPFITMEFVDGHDIDWLLQRKHRFKRSEALNVLQQTCDALDFAHKKNVVHQDLKSTNIILTSDMHVKITDFGIAGLDEIAAAQTKKLLSIPYYISPEQALGEKVTPASDLFSLGIIMYQILSGQLPFPGTSAANVIMMIARDNPSTPKDLEKSGIRKEDWDSFFGTALAKSPAQRFRSAREMFDALSQLLPAGDARSYPYATADAAVEVPDTMEKTMAGGTPTMMMDASQMLEEDPAPGAKTIAPSAPVPKPPAAPAPLELEQTMAEPVSAFDLLTSAAPQSHSVETASAPTTQISLEELQNAAASASPATVMIQAPKFDMDEPPAPTQAEKEREAETFASESAPTQMVSLVELMAASSAAMPPEPTPIPEPVLEPEPIPEFEMEPMATMKPATMKPQTPPPSKTIPPSKSPGIDAEVLMATPPAYSELDSTMLTNKPIEEPEMTMRPAAAAAPPPPPAPEIKKDRTLPPKPAAPIPPPPPAPKPAAAAQPGPIQPKGAKSALKIYLFIALFLALGILGAGLFFFLPKLMHKDVVVEQPKPQPPPPIKVEPKPEPPKQEPVVIAPTTGKITISSEPAGASVLLGDEDKGVTPVEIPDVPFGKYTLKLKLKGYQDVQQDVELSADVLELNVPVTMEKVVAQLGTLLIESNPTGAFIVISDRVLGTTPKTLPNQKVGKISITLKKDGYRDFSGTVKIVGGKQATFQGNLEEIPKVVVQAPTPPKPVQAETKAGQLVELGPGVTPPKSVKKVPAKYPDAAKKQRMEGIVGMNILVSETGSVIDVKVTKSANPLLDKAAEDAVRQWKYQPATKDGVVVKVWIPVNMSFQSGK